ncbi:MAG: dihydroorotase [Rickettsiales bacterium]|jgi:dihydroorotase|nr:dihydroorotase [Rickettsiales bacterium]
MIFKNARIVSQSDGFSGEVFDIEVRNETIVAIAPKIEQAGSETIDLQGNLVLPSFVDMHVHFREPGFEQKETIATGVRAAIRGGFSTVCPMANTNPVNDNIDVLNYCLGKIKKLEYPVCVYPIVAVTKNLESKELTDLVNLKKAGAIAFSDDGLPVRDMRLLRKAMEIAKDNDLLIISHAEDLTIPDKSAISEVLAVARELELLRTVNCRYHFAHISTERSLELIRQAKADGINVTCETAPHYFTLSVLDIPSREEGRYKMNPPLRTREDIDAIIRALKDGVIDVIATDHAPHTIEEKKREWDKSPFGIVGLETALSLSLTYLVKKNNLSLSDLVEKMCYNPAKILKVDNKHGHLTVGRKADFTVIDEEAKYRVHGSDFLSKCKITCYEDMEVQGKVIKTIIGGKIYDNKFSD